MRTSTTWTGTLTALSSVAHDGERRGTVSLLRREKITTPEGRRVWVPLVSGNGLRGALRRVAADLFVEALELEGKLSLPAAQLLRGGGGALTKSSKAPLTGEPLRRLRQLVPPVAVLGGTVSARTISGALQVGKVQPHLAETAHLTGAIGGPTVFEATGLESYTRAGDSGELVDWVRVPLTGDGSVDAAALARTSATGDGGPMLYRVETFPAGTKFSTWLRLERAEDLAHAFVVDVVEAFARSGRLGGRRGIGHGVIEADWRVVSSPAAPPAVDWRDVLRARRDEVLAVLDALD